MKRKMIKYSALGLCMLALQACNDYFDVRPKSQVLAEYLFETEEGFDDQLTGVYKQLASTSLYGKELTFGFMETLSQNYDLPAGSPYEEAAKYNYESTTIKSKIDAIWSGMYTAIANINVMMEYIDKDLSIFTGDHHNIYKGEALCLRGFIHLELLRMFAPTYGANPDAPAIPYVTAYSPEVTEQSTVAKVLDYIIKDLEEAAGLLTIPSDNYNYNGYRADYYLANTLLARAYWWKGDAENALKYARVVINDSSIEYLRPWVYSSSLESSDRSYWDRMFSTELLFRLEVLNLDDITDPYFKNSGSGTDKLSPSLSKWEDIYEYSKGYGTDFRYSKHWEYDGSDPYFAKYWQYENGMYNNMVPVVRKSEAYYIAAEALASMGSVSEAVAYLNEVRSHRNLSEFPLEETISANELQNEIYKEVRKETVGEGQLFFFYKRLKYTNIPGSSVPANDAVYVLPMPDNEKEFGKRK